MAVIAFASIQDLLGEVTNYNGIVLADNYWGQTIQVRPGQVVRKTFSSPVDPNTITLSSDAIRWLRPPDPHASHTWIGQADFEAVHAGLSTIKIKGLDTWQFGPVIYFYDILVRDRTRPYDLALSEKGISSTIWNPSGFALRVGDEVVVVYADGQVLTTDPSVVVPTLRLVLGGPGGFRTFRAVRAGTAQIGLQGPHGYWLPATIVVSNSASRFDLTANDPSDGKVLQMRVGESLGVTLKNLPKYQPWSVTWDEAGVMILVDPKGIGLVPLATFGFQVLKPGTREINFRAQPAGCSGQACNDETREIHLRLQISS
jgi:hypothetical protein